MPVLRKQPQMRLARRHCPARRRGLSRRHCPARRRRPAPRRCLSLRCCPASTRPASTRPASSRPASTRPRGLGRLVRGCRPSGLLLQLPQLGQACAPAMRESSEQGRSQQLMAPASAPSILLPPNAACAVSLRGDRSETPRLCCAVLRWWWQRPRLCGPRLSSRGSSRRRASAEPGPCTARTNIPACHHDSQDRSHQSTRYHAGDGAGPGG